MEKMSTDDARRVKITAFAQFIVFPSKLLSVVTTKDCYSADVLLDMKLRVKLIK